MEQKGFEGRQVPLFESLYLATENLTKQDGGQNEFMIEHKQINLPRFSILWNCWVIAMVPAGSTVIITQIVSPKKFPVAW